MKNQMQRVKADNLIKKVRQFLRNLQTSNSQDYTLSIRVPEKKGVIDSLKSTIQISKSCCSIPTHLTKMSLSSKRKNQGSARALGHFPRSLSVLHPKRLILMKSAKASLANRLSMGILRCHLALNHLSLSLLLPKQTL